MKTAPQNGQPDQIREDELAYVAVTLWHMWLYVAVTLTHALCARITEVLKLKASDFHWSGRTVTIAALKRQPQAG